MENDIAADIRLSDRDFVREIVRRCGWNGTSYQILNPGFQFWVDAARDAVVGFVTRHGVRVVEGGPVCADERLDAVMQRSRRTPRLQARVPCTSAPKIGGSHWEPVYASLAPATTLPRALLAVTAAFSGEPLRQFGPHLIARALARETRRLLHV